ncbi:MAG TPA: hypothetical protein VIU13_20505 [Chryseolinea sp.]
MKSPSRLQQHPHQEDKTGRPSYASRTKINYSTNDPRTNDDTAPKERQKKFIRIRSKKH